MHDFLLKKLKIILNHEMNFRFETNILENRSRGKMSEDEYTGGGGGEAAAAKKQKEYLYKYVLCHILKFRCAVLLKSLLGGWLELGHL